MASHLPEQSEDSASSLGDSAYEMLGDSITLMSEDDEHEGYTDSVVSVNDISRDEIDSFTGTEDSLGARDTESARDPAERTDNAITLDPILGDPNYGENITKSTSGLGLSNDTLHGTPLIMFPEPHFSRDTEKVSVAHRIFDVDRERGSLLFKHLLPEQDTAEIHVSIRQTMTQCGLNLDEPFRVCYIGTKLAHVDIMQKLGKALAVPLMGRDRSYSSPGQGARFNVIPISDFGEQSSPDVELIESYGIELMVDECLSATSIKVEGRPDTLKLSLKSGVSCYSISTDNGWSLEAPNHWKMPHLAVFFCSKDEGFPIRQNRLYTRSFMFRHGVPSIVISEDPLLTRTSESYALDHNSLHMCVESREQASMDTRILKRLPIDLQSFLQVDPTQMNRNLAALTGLYGQHEKARKAGRVSHELPQNKVYKSSVVPFLSRLRRWWNQEQITRNILMVIFILFMTAFVSHAIFEFAGRTSGRVTGNSPSSTTQSINLSTATTAAPKPSDSSTKAAAVMLTPGQDNLPKALSVFDARKEYPELFATEAPKSSGQKEAVKIHVTHDGHLVLRSPEFTRLSVHRHDRLLSAHVSKIFDGVHIVDLAPEDTYGTVNVSVFMKSRKVETLEAEFKSPWFNRLQWQNDAKNTFQNVQQELLSFTGQASKALDSIASNIDRKLAAAGSKAHGIITNMGSWKMSTLAQITRAQIWLDHGVSMIKAAAQSHGSETAHWLIDLFTSEYKGQQVTSFVRELSQRAKAMLLRQPQELWKQAVKTHKPMVLRDAQRKAHDIWYKAFPKSEGRRNRKNRFGKD